jgi:hypothetical protein
MVAVVVGDGAQTKGALEELGLGSVELVKTD